MKGEHLKFLRECADISQSGMAKILGVSLRTIAKWESDGDSTIAPGYIKICQTSLENLILAPILRRGTEKIFEKIPSEFVGIWLVQHSLVPRQYAQDEMSTSRTSSLEVIRLENTARYHCLCQTADEKNSCYRKAYCDEERSYYNDRIHENMTKKTSLITYPLRSGETLNLAGDDIANSPHKFHAGRANPYYHDQLCHSLLHVPYLIPNVTGPQPVALLSLDNKLEKDEDGHWRVISFPEGTTGRTAFTKEDEKTAKDLIKKMYEEEEFKINKRKVKLKDVLEAFDYLPSEFGYAK